MDYNKTQKNPTLLEVFLMMFHIQCLSLSVNSLYNYPFLKCLTINSCSFFVIPWLCPQFLKTHILKFYLVQALMVGPARSPASRQSRYLFVLTCNQQPWFIYLQVVLKYTEHLRCRIAAPFDSLCMVNIIYLRCNDSIIF